MVFDYQTLKDMAQRQGKRVTDLIALSRNHDPFYVGTPTDLINAKWFADLWNRFGYTTGIHLRRVHYQIVSQEEPVLLPSGTPYSNTEHDWAFLGIASEKARYLGLVDYAAFDDRRNPEAIIHSELIKPQPSITVDASESWILESLPHFPDLPTYDLTGYTAVQHYGIELWCEKSTMNDVLIPICQQYGVNLQTGVGELSIIKTFELFERIRQAEHPIRIGYISDFDPAGRSMPTAVARKLEFFLRTQNGHHVPDVKLFPICLSIDQVREYQLPRTPIKDSEKRKNGFENRFGEGAVELDALEALHPGSLAEIVCSWLDRYFDHDLQERVGEVRRNLEENLSEVRDLVIAEHEEEIDQLRKEWAAIRKQYDSKIKAFSKKVTSLIDRVSEELENNTPDLESFPIPEAEHANEIEQALYDSSRDYFEQLAAYKQFQGRAADEHDEDDPEALKGE